MIEDILGYPGKIMTGSKGRYRHNHPTHVTVFNAVVRTDQCEVWHGDLDLTLDLGKLKTVSEEFNCPIYVFYEGEQKGDIDRAIVIVKPNRTASLGHKHKEYFTFKDGTVYNKHVPEVVTRESLIKEEHVGTLSEDEIVDSVTIDMSKVDPADPYMSFYTYISNCLGIDLKDINVSNIILNVATAEKLNALVYDWIASETRDDEYRTHQTFRMQTLSYGPVVVDADWADDNKAYIRER